MLDYYGLRRIQLNDCLSELEQASYQRKQASERLNQARKIHETQKRKIAVNEAREAVKNAERDMRRAAKEAVKIEPHLAYLWFKGLFAIPCG